MDSWVIAALVIAVLALSSAIALMFMNANLRTEIEDLQGSVKSVRSEIATLGGRLQKIGQEMAAEKERARQKSHLQSAAKLEQPVAAQLMPMTPAPAAEASDGQLQEIVTGWNHLAADASSLERNEFVQRFAAQSADLAAVVHDAADFLWWIPISNSIEGVVLPGWKPLRDWQKSYRGLMGEAAREELAKWYAILPGDAPSILSPAKGRLGPDKRIELIAPGEMKGA